MFSINTLIYSQYFAKKTFENFSREELDMLMDIFVEEGSIYDIYDFKFRNDAALDYNVEDKLSNIKAKTFIFCATEDGYYSPEFDVYPLKDKIENLEIYIFDDQEFVYKYDYSVFVNPFRKFLEEFKK
jgi:homoserine O-acetyltransferase